MPCFICRAPEESELCSSCMRKFQPAQMGVKLDWQVYDIIQKLEFHERGLVVHLGGDTLLFYLEGNQYCCEEFDLDVVENTLKPGMVLESVTVLPLPEKGEEKGREECYEITLLLQGEGGELKLRAWCEHNGYYPHTFRALSMKYEGLEEEL